MVPGIVAESPALALIVAVHVLLELTVASILVWVRVEAETVEVPAILAEMVGVTVVVEVPAI